MNLHVIPFKVAPDTIFYLYTIDASGQAVPVDWIHGTIDDVSKYAFTNHFDSVIMEEKPLIRRSTQNDID